MKHLFITTLFIFGLLTHTTAHTTIHISTETSQGVEVKLIHLYPPEGNHLMGLTMEGKDTPTEKALMAIYLIHKGEKTDLTNQTTPFSLTNDSEKVQGLNITLRKRTELRGSGDFIVISKHIPHHKPNDFSIQLVTKSFYNKNGFLTDWPHRVLENSPEIIPLVNPTSLYVGDLFRAYAVNEKGEPIAHAQINIEYLNRPLKNNYLGITPLIPDSRANHVIYTNNVGEFSFIPQAKGTWSFTLIDGDSGLSINKEDLIFNSLITIQVH